MLCFNIIFHINWDNWCALNVPSAHKFLTSTSWSPRLAMKRTRLEAEMESLTIRKVRAWFGEAEKWLFSPIQECLISLPSVIEVIAVKASYYFVNGFTRNIFTVYTTQNIAQFNIFVQYRDTILANGCIDTLEWTV